MLSPTIKKNHAKIPVIKTIASEKSGIHELVQTIQKLQLMQKGNDKKYWLLTEQAFHLIQNKKMKNVNKSKLKERIEQSIQKGNFNLYHFIEQHS